MEVIVAVFLALRFHHAANAPANAPGDVLALGSVALAQAEAIIMSRTTVEAKRKNISTL
jgi:hypothetical protein